MNVPKIIIAIDGYSSCGKSTMAKNLAKSLDYNYIDTGAMYRAITLYALREGLIRGEDIDSEALEKAMPEIRIDFGKEGVLLNDEKVEAEIRNMEVARHVSAIASLGFVREALVAQQRRMGRDKGLVMDGRDIGTVVFPDAELKFFITASPEIRARRRLAELQSKGIKATYEEVLDNVRSRDEQDMNRAVSPLRQAADAIVIDNSEMDVEEQNKVLLNIFKHAKN
jgi:cytidylate kinase